MSNLKTNFLFLTGLYALMIVLTPEIQAQQPQGNGQGNFTIQGTTVENALKGVLRTLVTRAKQNANTNNPAANAAQDAAEIAIGKYIDELRLPANALVGAAGNQVQIADLITGTKLKSILGTISGGTISLQQNQAGNTFATTAIASPVALPPTSPEFTAKNEVAKKSFNNIGNYYQYNSVLFTTPYDSALDAAAGIEAVDPVHRNDAIILREAKNHFLSFWVNQARYRGFDSRTFRESRNAVEGLVNNNPQNADPLINRIRELISNQEPELELRIKEVTLSPPIGGEITLERMTIDFIERVSNNVLFTKIINTNQFTDVDRFKFLIQAGQPATANENIGILSERLKSLVELMFNQIKTTLALQQVRAGDEGLPTKITVLGDLDDEHLEQLVSNFSRENFCVGQQVSDAVYKDNFLSYTSMLSASDVNEIRQALRRSIRSVTPGYEPRINIFSYSRSLYAAVRIPNPNPAIANPANPNPANPNPANPNPQNPTLPQDSPAQQPVPNENNTPGQTNNQPATTQSLAPKRNKNTAKARRNQQPTPQKKSQQTNM